MVVLHLMNLKTGEQFDKRFAVLSEAKKFVIKIMEGDKLFPIGDSCDTIEEQNEITKAENVFFIKYVIKRK